jgi:hypothetical protein
VKKVIKIISKGTICLSEPQYKAIALIPTKAAKKSKIAAFFTVLILINV